MGIFTMLGQALAEKNAEMAWNVYNRAQRQAPEQLKCIIQEQESRLVKAAVLLVLIKKDRRSAQQIYNANQQLYDSTYRQLSTNHGGFAQEIARMESTFRDFKSSYY
ncbi:MAG: hypothetical protein PUF61_10980 [Spirochaetales bacterium]|nr:hypothetical protein [Spirochaetales bacterium]